MFFFRYMYDLPLRPLSEELKMNFGRAIDLFKLLKWLKSSSVFIECHNFWHSLLLLANDSFTTLCGCDSSFPAILMISFE